MLLGNDLVGVSNIKYDFIYRSQILTLKKESKLKTARLSEDTYYKILTNANTKNSGFITSLNDSTEVWKLVIVSTEKHNLEIMFDTLKLDTNDVLTIGDGKKVWDIFTHNNTQNPIINYSSRISNDSVTLELYRHKDSNGILSIKYVFDFNYLAFCEGGGNIGCLIDVNSSIGQPYQNQKRAVIRMSRMIIEGNVSTSNNCANFCTATLLNNSNNDYKPVVYTATHCLQESVGEFRNNGGKNFRFYFNYESGNQQPGYFDKRENYVLGANLLAFSDDNLLIELAERPDLRNNAFYAGFDLNQYNSDFLFAITHPEGGLKKISIHSSSYITNQGGLLGGSSGGPFFDNINKRVVANVQGYSSSASNCGFTYPIPNTLSYFNQNARDRVGTSTSLHEFLTNNDGAVTEIDGRNHCPRNEKFVNGNSWYYQLEKNYHRQIAGKFTISDCDLSNATVDFQATEKIILTSGGNGKSFRVKPTYNVNTPNPPYYYPYYFRARAFACQNSNPDGQRTENQTEIIHHRLFKNIYPNPSESNFSIDFINENVSLLEIYNSSGKKVKSINLNNQINTVLELDDLYSGLYYIKAFSASETDSYKIIVKK